MNQCSHGIDGLRSGLSPSARPFAIDSSPSSTFSLTASKSEHDDSIWFDYNLDLSFLSSDDQRSCLDDDDSLSNLSRDVEATKGQLLEGNSNSLLSKLPELLIKSSDVAGDDDKMDLSCADTTVMSEKSCTETDQDDSEEDSPCWIGINSRKTLASGAKSVTSRRSTDDLSGFRRLNPLAPQFVPSNSKKNLDTDGKRCEENGSSSSLKKSLSSNFPSSSAEFNLTDPPEDESKDAVSTSNLDNTADESLGFFVSRDSISKTVSMSNSKNEYQPAKKLDPLAPVFVPSSAKLSPSSAHEKQGDFETNAHSASALASSDKSLNTVNVVASSGEVGHSFKSRYGVQELGSYTPWIESEVGITENAKLGTSSNKSSGRRRLNPLAPQFSLSDTKPKAYFYENYQAADDLSLVVSTGYTEHNVIDADLAQSSVYVEHLLPNMSRGSSSLISPKTDSNFGSTKWFAVEPNTTLSVHGNQDFQHPLPFHVVETAASSSSSDVKALSGPSPKMDVKKLLTTMHGLSEILTVAHGSESPDAVEVDLINSTVQNLNIYIKNSTQELAGNQSVARRNSYDLKLLPNKSKLSIRDLQLPRANDMTVDLDVKRKEKYSVVSGETVPDSRLYQYGVTKDNSFGQVVAKSGYQQNHQAEEQINQHALFYKSLWLKAEADRCLMVYETSLSNPNS
ncbi:hypothetical protein EUTSA_v10006985mg [Eutrema salsugineum]|uniref:Uncharacterized protein n=1 Tax=Eutrema salsugineum TaxID=72664 RepID=V4L176_EUTSA|nr:uncharacterized protein LOC18991745 [Eutrema salsugineum]ESQ33482.1 hypothetical protein EUTSA_v10006985mg [Eutrema salsugineum]ESQ33483.1 hypothetical protein EUTSA_v10006985mg [Eutrema salsugineum]